MTLLDIAQRGVAELSQITGLKLSTVMGLCSTESGWQLQAELVEKESIPQGMDILGYYEAQLDAHGNLRSFERTRLRRRGDTDMDVSA